MYVDFVMFLAFLPLQLLVVFHCT